MTAEILYPVAEVADLWRCSRRHVYDEINRGLLRTVNLGHGRAKTRIPASALDAYVAARGEGTEPPAGPHTPPPPPRPRSTR